jgi:hypothetical protein
MSDKNIKLLVLWHHKCKLFYKCHRESAEHYTYRNKLLSLPTIIINIFNSTTLFATYQNISEIFLIIIACTALLATILAATQNYLDYGRLSDEHTKLTIEYSKILFSIEKIIILINNDENYKIDEVTMNTVLTNFERLRETFIHFPEKIWKNNNKLYKIKLEKLDVNTSDSVNILLNTLKNKKNLSFLNDSPEKSEIITYDNQNKSDTSDKNITNELKIVVA